MNWRTLIVVMLAITLSACGFKLRGRTDLPFETLYVEGMDFSPFTGQLRRAIESSSDTKLTKKPEDAQAVLSLLGETQERLILAVSGGGRVREFQLRYRVSFRVYDGTGKEWLPSDEVILRRDLTFDDTQVLAKENEAQLLFRDMQTDAVQQVLRRVQAIKASSVDEG